MDFNSVKVLRSHIENIPIPIVSEKIQNDIIELTDILIENSDKHDRNTVYDRLDQLIFDLFHLSIEEQQIIKSAL